jgi:hypothetical protein
MNPWPKTRSPSAPVWGVIAGAFITLFGVICAAVISKYYRPPNLKLVDVNISEKAKVVTSTATT